MRGSYVYKGGQRDIKRCKRCKISILHSTQTGKMSTPVNYKLCIYNVVPRVITETSYKDIVQKHYREIKRQF